MARSDDLPEKQTSNAPVPPRNFTTHELEAVISRAVELQAGGAALAEDGISEVDVVRIGQELGLHPSTVRRAMAEVRNRPVEESGMLNSIAGDGVVRATRVLRRPAAATGFQLDRYMREAERMVAQRRFADRTRYVRDTSLAAGLARFAGGFSRSHKPLDLQQLDIAVSTLDADSCLVELTVDLTATRTGLVAGVIGGATAAAGAWATVVWATAIVDPLMLLGIPVLAGSWFGTRAIYGTITRSTLEKLESLLDRVEHNDLGS